MERREEILREIGQLEYQLIEINGLFREFLARGDCTLLCTFDMHVCALRVIHNFVKRLRERMLKRIETLQIEMDQIRVESE